jgi:tight adherence protein B
MQMQTIALFFLVSAAIGGVVWVFLYPILSGERKAEKRMDTVARSGSVAPAGPRRPQRDQVAPRAGRGIAQGAGETQRQVRAAVGEDRAGRPELVDAPVLDHQRGARRNRFRWSSWSTAAAAGARHGICGGLRPAAMAAQVPEEEARGEVPRRLPDAVDIIVRGIKAGLPLVDSLRIITVDAPEPLKSEFRAILDTQTIGIPIGEACGKLYERIPVPEANFFGIVIGIQQKAGGNLSEALGNLSRVLRERKKMKAKIQAMSMEAKASAMIIGALPICGDDPGYITSPQYIELLWTEAMGRMMLLGCVAWMSIGIFVMRKMINFDF